MRDGSCGHQSGELRLTALIVLYKAIPYGTPSVMRVIKPRSDGLNAIQRQHCKIILCRVCELDGEFAFPLEPTNRVHSEVGSWEVPSTTGGGKEILGAHGTYYRTSACKCSRQKQVDPRSVVMLRPFSQKGSQAKL